MNIGKLMLNIPPAMVNSLNGNGVKPAVKTIQKLYLSNKAPTLLNPSTLNTWLKKKVAIAGAKLLVIKQKHLGSDHLPESIDGICDYLVENGVDLIDRADVTDIKTIKEDSKTRELQDEFYAASKKPSV